MRRWRIPTESSAVMVAHRLLSSAMLSNEEMTGLFIRWRCPSDWCDLRLWWVSSTVPVWWFSAAYYDGRHGRTMITCDAWRLTIRTPDVLRDNGLMSYIFIRFFVSMVWYVKHPSSCTICSHRLGLASTDPQSTVRSHIRRAILTILMLYRV